MFKTVTGNLSRHVKKEPDTEATGTTLKFEQNSDLLPVNYNLDYSSLIYFVLGKGSDIRNVNSLHYYTSC